MIDQAWQAQMRERLGGMLALVASLNLSVCPEAALVLARAATRHGSLPAGSPATGLGHSSVSETGHDVHLARCHGALGEVLVRCNFAALALQHMQIAHNPDASRAPQPADAVQLHCHAPGPARAVGRRH